MKQKKIDEGKIQTIIFIISFFFFLTLGLILSYTFDFSNNYNLIFEADTYRVINDISIFIIDHSRISVHPLFLIIVQPIYYMIYALTFNRIISIIIISTIASSISIVYIYKILSIFSKNIFTKIIIVLIYSFSLTNIVFTSCIELYNYATLFLIILFYYFIKKIKNKNIKDFIFPIIGLFTFGFTITNFIIFLIIIFILFISKRLSFLKSFKIVFITLSIALVLNIIQSIIWPYTPNIFNSKISNEKSYINYNIKVKNIKNVLKNDYIYSLIGTNVKVKVNGGYLYEGDNYVIDFKNNTIVNIVLIVTFYLLLILLVIRNVNYELHINLALGLSLLYNTLLHLVYGNSGTFLYSMHFLYLIILLLGINLLKEKSIVLKKVATIFLFVFIIFEIFNNLIVFNKIIIIVKEILNNLYLYKYLGIIKYSALLILLSLLTCILIYLIIKYYRNIDNNLKHSILIIIICFILFKVLFLVFNYYFEKNNPYKYIEKGNYEISNYIHGNLENKYKKEFLSLKEYEKEYNAFINKYNPIIVNDISKYDFYFFGMANRKKILFLKGGLLDIETKKYLYKFNIEHYIIIPNIYTVLIETTEKDYIKIFEDNSGVYIIKNNNKVLIDGTQTFIDLYDFSNQEYKEMKKVLYQEILFNIKDSIIYPNILVYDNPWYRDAAMTSMALKETNNTDLISDWVKNITDVYDKQNNGVNEPDNLGELLYIISTQKKYNTSLINKIEKAAEYNIKLSNNNYLEGYTDFTIKTAYQNLWYKFGIESIGKTFTYDLNGLTDDYENLTWWSNNKNNTDKIYDYPYDFPYLSMAQYHKLKKGNIYINKYLYPLSWEKNAIKANYDNIDFINDFYKNNKVSLTHTWSASEFLLFLLDETNDL